MVDSGGLCVLCMVSTTNIFHNIRQESPLTIPPHVSLTILAPTRCQYRTHVCPRQRFLRIPSGGHVRYKRVNIVTGILFPTAKNFHHAFPGMIIISHEITNVSKNTSVLQSSQNNTQQILNQVSECLPSRCRRVGCTTNCLKVYSSLRFLFWKIFELTRNTKTVQKVVFENFRINMKIN